MWRIDEVSTTVETEDRVLRADNLEEEAKEGATTTRDFFKDDGKMTVLSTAKVRVLSP